MQHGNYSWAIETIKIGLGIDPEFMPLQNLYARCESIQGNFKAAIEIYKKIRYGDQDRPAAKMNMAELYILNKEFKEFDELMAQSQSEIGLLYDGNILPYLLTLKEIQMGNIERAKEAIRPFVESRPDNETSLKLGNFDFSELNLVISKMTDPSVKNFAVTFKNFFGAGCTKEVMEQAINT